MNVSVRRLPLALFAIAVLSAGFDSQGQTTVATNPVGYNTLTLPVGNSPRVNTFVQPTAFQGIASAITSASDSVITVSGTGAILSTGSFNETASGPVYYLEVLSSDSTQGLIADVIANTSTTVTVDANLAALGVSGTATFCVRPHTTLSSLFPATSGFTAGVDEIELFFPNNTSQTYLFTGSGDAWVNASTAADAGSQIVYPGQGFIVIVQTAKTVPIFGTVKPGQTQVPLYPGIINLVGTINPMVSGTQTLSNFGFPGSLAQGQDSVQPFYDNGQLQEMGSYQSTGTYMYSTTSGSDSDTLTINPSNSVIVSVNQPKYWVMPSFFTSGTN